MDKIVFQLDCIPPSVNACYANNFKGGQKGRRRTLRYRQWANAAGWQLQAQKGNQFIPGPFECVITIDRSKRRANADIDNRVKPTLDLLQQHKVIDDDKYCEQLTIRWGEADGGMQILLKPAQVLGVAA